MEPIELLFQSNSPESYTYAGIYTLLHQKKADRYSAEHQIEYELQEAEYNTALTVLDKFSCPLPNKITLVWLAETAENTSFGTLDTVEIGFIHFSYSNATTLYSFTKTVSGELFVDKEIMSEKHSETLLDAVFDRSLMNLEPELEVTNVEMEMLAEMIGAALFVSKPI